MNYFGYVMLFQKCYISEIIYYITLTGFFTYYNSFDLSRLYCILKIHSFLLLRGTPWFECSNVCIFNWQIPGLFPTFGYYESSCYRHSWRSFCINFHFLKISDHMVIAGSYSCILFYFCFLRNCQRVLQGKWTVLHI